MKILRSIFLVKIDIFVNDIIHEGKLLMKKALKNMKYSNFSKDLCVSTIPVNGSSLNFAFSSKKH